MIIVIFNMSGLPIAKMTTVAVFMLIVQFEGLWTYCHYVSQSN